MTVIKEETERKTNIDLRIKYGVNEYGIKEKDLKKHTHIRGKEKRSENHASMKEISKEISKK